MLTRRSFIQSCTMAIGGVSTYSLSKTDRAHVMTVNGPIHPEQMGWTLIHEHILVDFIGAANIDPNRWHHQSVISKMLPRLLELKKLRCNCFVDCTPNYLGRDVRLLKKLSDKSGLHFITNTGYYGGSDHKFLPAHSFTESAAQLSERWVQEARSGIDGTSIKPGFIKISVNDGPLSPISRKLIEAAALTHKKTGLPIASHTGGSIAAFEQLEVIEKAGADSASFIWVHAQNETDWSRYIAAVKKGCWVSLDGISEDNIEEYISRLKFLQEEKSLHRTLVSHDAGWYDPDRPDGEMRKYTPIFTELIPALSKRGFSEDEIDLLMTINPSSAFTVRV
jgi:phosphotriesterase-related protein